MRTSAPKFVIKPLALSVALALAGPHAFAAPTGHTVVAGQIQVTQPNAQAMVISQGTDKAIVNWRGFSIAAGETVQFVQPNSSSVALNRVTGTAPSEIFGRLSANGKVFLVNPSGVMFVKGASVDVGGLVASTLDLRDDDFLAGRYAFADTGSAAAVRNEGRLAAADRGTIALLGAQVSNDGTVTARLGTVALAAAGKVTLDFSGDGLTRIVVDAARINALVENGGAIIADGGQVTMTARAAGAVADSVVRQHGVVQATALVERNGRIVLDGGAGGKVELAGRVDATGLGAGQRGGAVTLHGNDIHLARTAAIDVSGDAGGGAVLVGGDYQGGNPLVPHAAATTMAAGATIRADALANGSGGKVILWSDGSTSAHGSASASARGGAQGGNGGIVETSGRMLDVRGMRVAAGAAKGAPGTWLLDPGDIVIDEEAAAAISDSLNNSTNVTVSTRAAENDGAGDILVYANIEKTAGGDTTLLLEASRDIVLDDVQIASLGSAGKLNVDFNADLDNSRGGAVALNGSAVLTNGGDVRIYGQDNPVAGRARGSDGVTDGVVLRNSTIDTRRGQSDALASGLISIAGSGADYSDMSSGFGIVPLPDPAAGAADSRFTLAMAVAEPVADGVGVRIENSSLLSTSGDITISGIGGTWSPNKSNPVAANGVVIYLAEGPRIATGSGALAISGMTGQAGVINSVPGLLADIDVGSSISTTGGAIDLRGAGAHAGATGIDISVGGGTVSGGGAVSLDGPGGVVLSLSGMGKLEAAGPLSITGNGAMFAHGLELAIHSGSIRAAAIAMSGDGAGDSAGVAGTLNDAVIESTGGRLVIEGAGSGAGAGVELNMFGSSIGASGGDVLISGTGGNALASGVAITSLSGSRDGSRGSGGHMTGSSARIYADGGNLTVEGINEEGTPDDTFPGRAVAGVDLRGIELRATGGGVLIAGAGLAEADNVPVGVTLTNVLATTAAPTSNSAAASPVAGTVRIVAGSTGEAPALRMNGVTLGGTGMNGNIIIGARIAGAGPVFSYPGTSQWANSVQTAGVINLRPDDGQLNYAGISASTIPISVGGADGGFNVAFAGLGIGGASPANVVIGSQEHTGQITFRDPTPFVGNLTLQNGGAGSAGIRLDSNLQASGRVTLSSGGGVSAPGYAIVAPGLLLHGSQPEANFSLTTPDNQVGAFAARFAHPAGTTRPEYGDVSFRNNGALALAPLAGQGFSTASNQATDIAGANTLVAGDLLLHTPERLTLAQGVGTRGGDITLVTGTFLDAGGQALAPGGAGTWRVFADTWVGENRTGLTPSPTHPNYYNCAYGDACGAAIAGNRFIYRAQPTVTLSADSLVRGYGAPNPALTFSQSGLVNGDTFADAVSGAFATTALQSSGVGAYAVTGAFTSPVGYAVNVRPGILAIDRAALLISADDKSKVYGAADPTLTATVSGLVLADTGAVVTGLTLSAPPGALATAGSHPILGANATAANYAITYRQGTLTVAKPPLAYVAEPTVQLQGAGGVPIAGGVTGFVYGDTLASATTGALQFAALAPALAPPGVYPVEGRGLSAANYQLVQAPANQTALTILPGPAIYRPTIAREITFESSNVYEKNFGSPRLCVGTGPLGSGSAASDSNDLLAMEWSRVRLSPNLSNCLGLGQRNSCEDF